MLSRCYWRCSVLPACYLEALRTVLKHITKCFDNTDWQKEQEYMKTYIHTYIYLHTHSLNICLLRNGWVWVFSLHFFSLSNATGPRSFRKRLFATRKRLLLFSGKVHYPCLTMAAGFHCKSQSKEHRKWRQWEIQTVANPQITPNTNI